MILFVGLVFRKDQNSEMWWDPLAPCLLQVVHDLAEIRQSTVEACGACPIMLEALKTWINRTRECTTISRPGTRFWKACLLFWVRMRSRETLKTSGHSRVSFSKFTGTTSRSVSWLICMHSALWITGFCEHSMTQTLPSTAWTAVVPQQPGLRFFCFRLCVGHSGGFAVGNDNALFSSSVLVGVTFWQTTVWTWLNKAHHITPICVCEFKCESSGGWQLFIVQFNVPSHVHSKILCCTKSSHFHMHKENFRAMRHWLSAASTVWTVWTMQQQ